MHELIAELKRRQDLYESAAIRNFNTGSNQAGQTFSIQAETYRDVLALIEGNKQ